MNRVFATIFVGIETLSRLSNSDQCFIPQRQASLHFPLRSTTRLGSVDKDGECFVL